MFWTKEYDFRDREIKHMYREYALAVGVFSGIIILAIVAAALL